LLLPLLQELPGAQWSVQSSTMERQVECVGGKQTCKENLAGSSSIPTTLPSQSSPSIPNQKPLNVLVATCHQNGISEVMSEGSISESYHSLDFDKVCQHVHQVNDQWFQEQQPLLTEERIQDLKRAFGVLDKVHNNVAVDGTVANCFDDQEKEDQSSSSKILSLEEAFAVLFTEAEREHLTFEHFLEDWDAFEEARKMSTATSSATSITFDVALQFLQETQ